MSRRITTGGARRNRRLITIAWVAAMTAIVIALLYWERSDLLYVLATLGLTILLVIVALADLGAAKKSTTEPAPADDAAAIGSGLTTTVASGVAVNKMRASKR